MCDGLRGVTEWKHGVLGQEEGQGQELGRSWSNGWSDGVMGGVTE